MSLDLSKTITPDSISVEWNDTHLVYQEEYEATGKVDPQQLVDTTETLAKQYVEGISEGADEEVEVSVDSSADGDWAEVTVEIEPGKLQGVPDLGLVALAGESMASLALSNPGAWDIVVDATRETAEAVLKEQARTNAGP